MRQVIITGRAKASLAHIIDYYLAEHSNLRKERVVNSINKMIERIEQFPLSFPICIDILQPRENIRQAIVHNTLKIIFRVSDGEIEVLEIFHSNRNPELLKEIGK